MEVSRLSGLPAMKQEVRLPGSKQLKKLVELYFTSVHLAFPILHPIIDKRKLLSNLLASNHVLLGVILNSLHFARDLFSEKQINEYTDSLKSAILLQCFRVQDCDELTAMTLLAFHNYSESNSPETWSTVSIIANGCVHLKLTDEGFLSDKKSTESDANARQKRLKTNTSTLKALAWSEWIHKENQRNLLWGIVTLDHLASLASFFAPKLSCASVNTLLPVRLEIWHVQSSYNKSVANNQTKTIKDRTSIAGEIYDTHSYKLEVLDLMESVQKFMTNPKPLESIRSVLEWEIAFAEQEEKIALWKESLPDAIANFLSTDELQLEPNVSIEDVIFHSLYHTLIIRLNSAIAFPEVNEKLVVLAKIARFKCLNSAKIICETSRKIPVVFSGHFQGSPYAYCGPFYAFSLWVAGRVLLVDALVNKTPVSKDLESLLPALRLIGDVWQCATKYVQILEFFRNSLEHPLPNSPPEEQLISDMTLHAASLEALLGDQTSLWPVNAALSRDSIYDLFKIPATESLKRGSASLDQV